MVIPVDEWELDAVVGGAQKCLSIPSGITPITFNERFSEEINKRKRVELGIRSNESPPTTASSSHSSTGITIP